MSWPTAHGLSITHLQEFMVANLISPYEFTEEEMRKMINLRLQELWTGNSDAWILPDLPKEALPWESFMCLQQWRWIVMSRPSGTLDAIQAETVDQQTYEKTTWSLLLVRLDRLRNLPPVALHFDAWVGLRKLLTSTYGFNMSNEGNNIVLSHIFKIPHPVDKAISTGDARGGVKSQQNSQSKSYSEKRYIVAEHLRKPQRFSGNEIFNTTN